MSAFVSIPFKRESPFGPNKPSLLLLFTRAFPFPSNGKALSDRLKIFPNRCLHLFPFPSNGKALSDLIRRTIMAIPYKPWFPFPSNGKALSDDGILHTLQRASPLCFHSLQTGKPFRTVILHNMRLVWKIVSIPFKRESPFGRIRREVSHERFVEVVSIPFKRESPFGRTLPFLITERANIVLVSIPFKRESPFGR